MESQLIVGICFALMLSLAVGMGSIAQEARGFPGDGLIPVLTACSQNGEFYLFARPDGRIELVRLEDEVIVRTIYHCDPRGAVFSSDGRLIATAGLSNGRPAKLKIWNVADGDFVREMETEVHNEIQLSFSPNGKYLASSAFGSRIDLWEVATGVKIQSIQANTKVARLFFSKHGEILVATDCDGSAWLFPVEQRIE